MSSADAETNRPPEETFMTIEEVAKFCKVSHWTVRDWIAGHRLKHSRLMRVIRIRKLDVLDMMARNRR